VKRLGLDSGEMGSKSDSLVLDRSTDERSQANRRLAMITLEVKVPMQMKNG
jgi:hypothetical protein